MAKQLSVFVLIALSVLAQAREAAAQREIAGAASSVAADIVASSKRTVAVVDFTDLQGNVTELGRFVAEEIALGFVTAKVGLSVVDRTHLRVLMQENKLDASGLIDPASARKIGQILGVEALVTGTITPFADSVRVVVKVLDTNTARIVAATSVDISKNGTITELLDRDIRSAPIAPKSAAVATAGGASNRGPVFQGGPIRVTVGQLGVAGDNSRIGVSLVIENVSREAIRIAIQEKLGRADISLSDDQATQWSLEEFSGIQKVGVVRTVRDENRFTEMQPGERITFVMNFRRFSTLEELRTHTVQRGTAGKLFSISASAVLRTTAGSQGLSIGLAGISAGSTNR